MATDQIGPVLAEYVAAATAALSPMPERIITYQPGAEVAWDGCCDGQLWGRVVTISPGGVQPIKANGLPCGIGHWDVTLALGIIRCVGVVNDKGKPPTAERITNDGAQMLADLAALQEVITCLGFTRTVVAWTPVGPQGGCAGGEWTFTVRLGGCGCPDPAPWDPEPETP